MLKRHLLAATAAALLTAAAAGPAQSALYVFGDSLVDAGNVALFLASTGQASQTNPAYGYEDGRFSNGPTYADILSQRLYGNATTAYGYAARTDANGNVVVPANIVGGNNFAWGGALAAEVTGDNIPSFSDQLALFGQSGKTLTADDLVLVTFGGNDIKALVGGRINSLDGTYAALRTGLTSLATTYGASRILVTGQADIGAIPSSTGNGAVPPNATATGLAFTVNQKFRTITTEVDVQYPAQITFFDLLAFQQTLTINPAAHTYTDTTHRCIDPATGRGPGGVISDAPNCTGYLYFDNTHPTKEAHEDIAGGIQARLQQVNAVPEPATWATMMLGFGVVGMAARRRRRAVAA